MSDTKSKELKVTVITLQEFSDPDFNPPSTWFFKDALGQYIFVHTSKRAVVQDYIDANYGKGKYSPIPTKDQKTKSRMESGGLSCMGTATRARPSSRPPK